MFIGLHFDIQIMKQPVPSQTVELQTRAPSSDTSGEIQKGRIESAVQPTKPQQPQQPTPVADGQLTMDSEQEVSCSFPFDGSLYFKI